MTLKASEINQGDLCNWKGQPERLVFIGVTLGWDCWYQFAKVGSLDEVWCEVLESDLHMLEKTVVERKKADDTEGGSCD